MWEGGGVPEMPCTIYTQKSSGYKLHHRCGKYPQYNSNGDVSIVGDCETPKRDEQPERGVGLEFIQLGHYATEVRSIYTLELYRCSTNYMVKFRAYASRDKSVEPDERQPKLQRDGKTERKRADSDQTNMYKADGGICLILSWIGEH